MDYETMCERPLWAAAVDGYTFRRDQRGRIVARCAVCKGAFTVTEANAEAVRGMMMTGGVDVGDVRAGDGPDQVKQKSVGFV